MAAIFPCIFLAKAQINHTLQDKTAKKTVKNAAVTKDKGDIFDF